jgi:hypothetical protein
MRFRCSVACFRSLTPGSLAFLCVPCVKALKRNTEGTEYPGVSPEKLLRHVILRSEARLPAGRRRRISLSQDRTTERFFASLRMTTLSLSYVFLKSFFSQPLLPGLQTNSKLTPSAPPARAPARAAIGAGEHLSPRRMHLRRLVRRRSRRGLRCPRARAATA